jgi:hypothetical protein
MFHLFLDSSTLLHKISEDVGQDSVLSVDILIRQFNLFLLGLVFFIIFIVFLLHLELVLNIGSIEVLSWSSVDGSEAKVVLLDDRRVQTVEVEQKDNVIIESSLRLDNQTTSILSLLPLGTLLSTFAFSFLDLLVTKHPSLHLLC